MIKVFTVDVYTSKKTGKQSYKVTGISEEGVVVFFVPLEDAPKKGDVYNTVVQYSSYNMGYVVRYVKA